MPEYSDVILKWPLEGGKYVWKRKEKWIDWGTLTMKMGMHKNLLGAYKSGKQESDIQKKINPMIQSKLSQGGEEKI